MWIIWTPWGRGVCLSVPRTIVLGHLGRLEFGRASNHLCSAHSTVELGAVEGITPPVHSNNTNGNNHGKGLFSAQSALGLKAHVAWTSHQEVDVSFHKSLCCLDKIKGHFIFLATVLENNSQECPVYCAHGWQDSRIMCSSYKDFQKQ